MALSDAGRTLQVPLLFKNHLRNAEELARFMVRGEIAPGTTTSCATARDSPWYSGRGTPAGWISDDTIGDANHGADDLPPTHGVRHRRGFG
jgi:hypothetical protein